MEFLTGGKLRRVFENIMKYLGLGYWYCKWYLVFVIIRIHQSFQIGESFFAIAISRMDEDVIWQRYFRDFFHEKLNFPITTSGYLHDLMSGLLFDEGARERESCLGDWNAEYKVPFLIVSLHFQFQIKRSFYKTS